MTEFDLNQFLPYQLAVLAARVSRGFAQEYGARFGLSIPEWRVMAHLSQAEAVSVRDVHVSANLEKSKVSRTAARLAAAGLVVKAASASDRRLVELRLTEKGRAMMDQLTPLAREYETSVLDRLGADDREVFRRMIGALVTATDPA